MICLCEFVSGPLVTNDNENAEKELVVILPCGSNQTKRDNGEEAASNKDAEQNETMQATALQQTLVDAHGHVEPGIKLEDIGIKVTCDDTESNAKRETG